MLYPSHDALQIPTLLGVFKSVCIPLSTRTKQLPTLLAQQRPFTRSFRIEGTSGTTGLAPTVCAYSWSLKVDINTVFQYTVAAVGSI